MSVHGVYYREHSTRVVQPMVQISKDLPNGFDVGVHGLVDAITSASVAAGAVADSIFTEYRKEAGLVAGKTMDRTRVGISFRHSAEPDYISDTAGLSVSQGIWDNTGTVALNLAVGRDKIKPKLVLEKSMKVLFGGVAYTQVISPTMLAQVIYEATLLDGYMANPYLRHPNLGREGLPSQRLRHAAAARVAQYFPRTATGVQLHYRYYVDQDSAWRLWPWGMQSHSVEGRVYQALGRDWEVRLSYRYNSQTAARFWCTNSSAAVSGDCYGQFPPYHSVDVKLGALSTHMPEAKLMWQTRFFERWQALRWLAGGTVDLAYGHYFQSTRYAGAHLLQSGYSLPF